VALAVVATCCNPRRLGGALPCAVRTFLVAFLRHDNFPVANF